MRIPVFARRANPSVDRPILRKSEFYAVEEVLRGRADWIDPENHRRGIICREMLYFGPRTTPIEVETVTVSRLPGEIPGLRFIPAKMEKNPTLPRLILGSLQSSAQSWDWHGATA